jgi:hypothetical protein
MCGGGNSGTSVPSGSELNGGYPQELTGLRNAAIASPHLRHAADKNRPEMRAVLRERLQAFVDEVMAAADESEGVSHTAVGDRAGPQDQVRDTERAFPRAAAG